MLVAEKHEGEINYFAQKEPERGIGRIFHFEDGFGCSYGISVEAIHRKVILLQ
jgi:hypothetical protein